MKTPIVSRLAPVFLTLTLAVLALQIPAARGANFVLGASDAAGASSFNSGLSWTGGAAPTNGNTYQTAAFRLRTPQAAASFAFQGDSLEVQPGLGLRHKTAGTITITNLIVTNTAIVELTQPNNQNLSTSAGTLAGGITLNGTATLRGGIAGDNAGHTFTISSTIGGTGGFTTAGQVGKIILTGGNNYSGGTTIAAGTLQLGNANAVSNTTVTVSVNNGLLFSSGIGTFNVGGLAGANNSALTDLAATAVTLVVGGNNSSSTYSGVLGGAGNLTKTGTGTLTLSNTNSYAGTTTVNAGKLAVTSAARLGTNGAVTVNDAATLGVTVSGTNQLSPASLTLGGGTGATNEFLGLNSTTIAPLKAGTLTLNGTNRLSIVSGSFVAGNSYPLIEYTSLAGSGTYALGTLPGGVAGNLSTSGNIIYLNVTLVAASIWTGAVNNSWDIGTTANWTVSGVGSVYSEGVIAEFNNAGANPNVNLLTNVAPASLTVSNSSTAYSFGGSAIGGIGGLTKLGSGTLTLSNLNTYAGATVISNGTVILGVDNAIPGGAGKGDVTVAGTLDLNTHNEIINGLSGSGTVDTVAGGAPVLTVGSNNASSTFAGVIKNSAGTLALTKGGSGALTLNGTNTYTGVTTVAGGALVIGANNPNGQTAFILTNAGSTLRFATNVNYHSALGLTLSAINETETITVDAGAQATLVGLAGGNAGNASIWLGGGGTLRLTNAATTFSGLLRINNAVLTIDDNAALTVDNNNLGMQIGSGVVPGAPTNSTGVVTVKGNGQLNMTLQGIRIASDGNGSTGVLNVQDNGVVTTPLIYLPRQGNNTGIVNQVGGIVNLASLQGAHSFAPSNWFGIYNLNGGTLAWTGVFGGGPVDPSEKMHLNLNGGLLQFTGSATIGGWSAINVLSNSARVDMMGNAVTINDGLVAGDAFGGGLSVFGSGGALTLAGTNTYTGNTTISNATLALSLPSGGTTSLSNSPIIRVESGATFDVNGVASGYHVVSGQTLRGNGTVSGAATVDAGGTLTVGGATGTPGTLTFNNNLTLAGNTTLRLDKSAASDQLTGIATLQAGGTLTLANVGPALANGDSFTNFIASSITGVFTILPITPGAGLAWDQSQLSLGIIGVITAAATPVISPELQNQTVECSANATFTAVATGSAPLNFRWSTNGIPVGIWTTNNPNVFTLTNVHSAGSVYTVSVAVTNSAGSTNSSATLTVQDTTAPVITMLGSNPMNVIAQSAFVDPGATATDGCEGTVTVTTNSTVDTNALGSYTVTYSAQDSTGNPSSVIRTVNVILATGVWTNEASGLWNTAANWLNGSIPGNNITVADFNSIDPTNDITVSLNSTKTVAGLTFGDLTNSTAAGWTLDNNANPANVLTLERFDGNTPVITANALGSNKTTTVSLRLATTNGLTKTGNGILILSAANTYSNVTTVAGGTLVISGGNTNLQTAFALTNANTTLRFASNANYTLAQGITISDATGNGEIVTVDGGAEVLFHGLTGGNNTANDTWFNGGGTLRMTNASTTYSGRLRLNNLHLIIDKDAILTQDSANVASSQIGSGLVPNTPINSTGIMTVRANGQFIQTAQGLRLGSDGNGATGILNVQDQGVVSVPLIYLPRTSGNTGVVNQAGGTVTTAAIQGPGAGAWQGTYNLNGGTLAWGGTFAGGPTVGGQSTILNLNGGVLQFTAGATVAGWTAINVKSSGAIIDTAGSAVTFTDPLIAGDAFGGGLTKTGNGTLTLSGANTYVGNTTINAGTLELVQPALATTSQVIVTNGAVLQLDFTVTNNVSALVLNGVTKTPGVYNNVTDPTYLTGLGSLQVASSVATNPTNITFTVSGNVLTLNWPADHTGWHLQAQTNSLTTGLGTNWVTIPNTDLSHGYTNTINLTNGSVFYRIVYP